ncbi:MAG: IS21 family transposase, partial [Gemmatimonadales bacterium]
MANQLKMAEVQAILTLHQHGWSDRRIARELEVHRETVGKHVRQAAAAESKPASAPTGIAAAIPGSEGAGASGNDESNRSKPASAPTGSEACFGAGGVAKRIGASAEPSGVSRGAPLDPESERAGSVEGNDEGSIPASAPPGSTGLATGGTGEASATWSNNASAALPWRDVIIQKLQVGLSAKRIYQDLTCPDQAHGYAGSYYSVRRLVQKLSGGSELPVRRMECAPGQEAQVDFGRGAPIVGPDGKRRTSWVFRIVLSHSRKGYSEAVSRQTTDDFLRCLENAFAHFRGVPKTLVIDNLRAAVTRADWFDPELCPKVRSFAEHYGTVVLPTRPRMPRHKGKVESGVKYVKANGLKGLKFISLGDQNRHLAQWESTVADRRIHGTTRQQVIKLFTDVERTMLLPLPASRFELFHEALRAVHRDGHVQVQGAYYL